LLTTSTQPALLPPQPTNNKTDGFIDPRANYRVIRSDRPNSRGGGVGILLSRYLDVIEVPAINYFPSLEIICIDIYDGASSSG